MREKPLMSCLAIHAFFLGLGFKVSMQCLRATCEMHFGHFYLVKMTISIKLDGNLVACRKINGETW